MKIKNIIAATLVTFASIAAPMAMAADVKAPVPYVASDIYIVENVNFDGPYVGAGVIYSNNTYTPVISAGYDARFDAFIVGGEVFATVNGEAPVVGVDVKAGVVVTENLAVYGIAGVQTNTGTGVNSNSVGVGADFAFTENVSLTGSYKQVYDFGTFDNRDDQYRVGLKVSF